MCSCVYNAFYNKIVFFRLLKKSAIPTTLSLISSNNRRSTVFKNIYQRPESENKRNKVKDAFLKKYLTRSFALSFQSFMIMILFLEIYMKPKGENLREF